MLSCVKSGKTPKSSSPLRWQGPGAVPFPTNRFVAVVGIVLALMTIGWGIFSFITGESDPATQVATTVENRPSGGESPPASAQDDPLEFPGTPKDAEVADGAGLSDTLMQAGLALAAGRFSDGPDSAIPLYQRVLAETPDDAVALAGLDRALQGAFG